MNTFALAGILVALLCTFLVTIAVLSGRSKLYLLLALFNVSVAFWGAGAYIVGIAHDEETALIGWKVANLGGYFISVFFYHLVCTFCDVRRSLGLTFGYAQAFIFNYLTFVSNTVIIKTRYVYGLYYHDGAPLYFLAVLVFFFVVSLSYIELFSFLKKATGDKRTRAIYIAVGFSFGFIFGSSTLLSCFGIDLFYPVGNFGICVYVLILTYGILRHRLFDVEAIVRAFQREKLATIGLLASSINHEIRNPLYAARGVLENFKEGIKKSPEEATDKALSQINRALDVITKLNRFAKPTTHDSQTTNHASIPEALQNVLDLVSYEFSLDKIHIKNNLSKEIPPIQADQRQLEEILFNLIVNACHALKGKEGGELTVSASLCHSEAKGHGHPRKFLRLCSMRRALFGKNLTFFSENVSGIHTLDSRQKHAGMTKTVSVTIQDTGTGISADQAKHLFEPFHTTKGDKGTGLGLYVTKQLVERNDGKIMVESKEGQGTIFRLEFRILQNYVKSTDN